MCGIFGLAGLPADDLRRIAPVATSLLAHRGPDGQGCFYADAPYPVALGHRRLSIIDLSNAGTQPMSNESGDVWITYNGEVYNFVALRAELETAGHVFASHTDTEVIVHGYEEHGLDFFARLRGMFALAIWDGRTGQLVLARDRLGIKPLYVYYDGQVFAFTSELKALKAIPGLDLTWDEAALYDVLTYFYVPRPRTIYRNVSKLPPGQVLCFDGQHIIQRAYWRLHDHVWRGSAAGRGGISIATNGHTPHGTDDLDWLRESLRDAVQTHLISDVPLGVFLSGGVDSSAVTAYAAQAVEGALRTFAIGFDVAEHNETEYARLVAGQFHTDHTERTVSHEDMRAALPRVVAMYDEPFVDGSAIPTLQVSALAREAVTVALSGDGGDEVFAGYRWHEHWLTRRMFGHVPRPARRAAAVAARYARRAPGVQQLLRDAALTPFEWYAAGVQYIDPAQKRGIFTPEFRARLGRDYDDYWFLRQHWHTDLDPVTRIQYLDLMTYLPEDILTKVDRASMQVSLEVRPPLLDHPLIEAVMGRPPEERYRAGELKTLFRQAMRGLLPDAILDRPKKGFSIPFHQWAEEQRGWIRDFVQQGEGVKLGIFNRDALDQVPPWRWWGLLVLEQWLRGESSPERSA